MKTMVRAIQRVMAMEVYRTRQQFRKMTGARWEDGFDDALGHHQNKIPQLDRVLAMVREFCAIGRESKVAEDGRQALEHTRGVRMVVYNLGEKNIQSVRVIFRGFHGAV